MKTMGYRAHCVEHDLPLVDGRCDKCRDAHGNTFVLDMQSTYLVPFEETPSKEDVEKTIAQLEIDDVPEKENIRKFWEAERARQSARRAVKVKMWPAMLFLAAAVLGFLFAVTPGPANETIAVFAWIAIIAVLVTRWLIPR